VQFFREAALLFLKEALLAGLPKLGGGWPLHHSTGCMRWESLSSGVTCASSEEGLPAWCSFSVRLSCSVWRRLLMACMPRLRPGYPQQPSTRHMLWEAVSGEQRCSSGLDVSKTSPVDMPACACLTSERQCKSVCRGFPPAVLDSRHSQTASMLLQYKTK